MIDFSQPGWFNQYIRFRKEVPFRIKHPTLSGRYYFDDLKADDMGQAQYFSLQATGLLYGFPIQPPAFVPKEKLGSLQVLDERTIFISLECLFSSLLIHHIFEEEGQTEYEKWIDEAGETIKSYYLGIHPGFRGSEKKEQGFEEAFRHRLKKPEKFYRRSRFGANSLLFWDVFYLVFYHEAVKVPGSVPAAALDIVQDYLNQMKMLTLEVIVVAAHSSFTIEDEEVKLFKQFLTSSGLNKSNEKLLKKHFKEGRFLDDLEIPSLPWIGKRYLLDTCLLTVMSDQRLTSLENDFLHDLVEKLGLDEKELEESKAQLGIFLLRYGNRIPFLKKRPAPLELLRSTVSKNVKKLFGAVWSESVETKEMAVTFGKMLSTKLRIRDREDLPSPEEIRAAMDQLKDIPRFAPFFGIIFMPLPGVTELYLLLAVTIEKMTDHKVQLLPTHFSNMMKSEKEEEIEWE